MRLQTSRDRYWAELKSTDPGHAPSTGSMGTLPMTDEEKEEAAKKAETRVVGFGSA